MIFSPIERLMVRRTAVSLPFRSDDKAPTENFLGMPNGTPEGVENCLDASEEARAR
jgi:hypothetical protein